MKLFVYDDGGDPNQARTFGTRAIEQDQVDALLAGSTTATTMAIIPLAEDAQVPRAVADQAVPIAQAIDVIADRLRVGGRCQQQGCDKRRQTAQVGSSL